MKMRSKQFLNHPIMILVIFLFVACGGGDNPHDSTKRDVTDDIIGIRIQCIGTYAYVLDNGGICNAYGFGPDLEEMIICAEKGATEDEILRECAEEVPSHVQGAWNTYTGRHALCPGETPSFSETIYDIVGYVEDTGSPLGCDPNRLNPIIPIGTTRHALVSEPDFSGENLNYIYENNKYQDWSKNFDGENGGLGFRLECQDNMDTCTVIIESFFMEYENASIGGVRITDMTCWNEEWLVGNWDKNTGDMAFPAENFILTCEFKRDGTKYVYKHYPNGTLYGTLFPEMGTVSLLGRLISNSTRDVDFSYFGTLKYTSPVSDIAVDKTVFECTSPDGATVEFDGTGSTGGNDAISYQWIMNGTVVSTSSQPTIQMPTGDTTVYNWIEAERGVGDVSSVEITVEDTTSPTIEETSPLYFTTCNPAINVHFESPTATDLCSDATVTGNIISMNGEVLDPAIEIDGTMTLVPGYYVVEWTAEDTAGNTTKTTQTVLVQGNIRTTQSVKLNDRSKVVSIDGYTAIVNSGSGTAQLGEFATSGTIYSQGSVVLDDNATVDGNIITAGIYQPQDHENIAEDQTTVTVNGTITEGATLSFPELQEDDLNWVEFPPTNITSPVYYNPRSEPYNLYPGSYPEIYINSGATIILHTGTYYFRSLNIYRDSTVITDESMGNIQIFVQNNLILHESFLDSTYNTEEIYLGYTGTEPVSIEAEFYGTLLFPNAKLTLGAAENKEYRAKVVAKEFELSYDAILTCIDGEGVINPPSEGCRDDELNQDETDVDCGGAVCPKCEDGKRCSINDDCLSNNCVSGVCESAPPELCNEIVAIDLGEPYGEFTTVATNACIRVRDGYPDWWGQRNMQLQVGSEGGFPVDYTWENNCSGGFGSGTFLAAMQNEFFGPTDDNCATVIKLNGDGSNTIMIRYYAN